MEHKQYLYLENQYLGRDRGWLTVRLILALFCFVAFYINLDRETDSQLFFIVGLAIVVVSVVMMYMLHYRIVVDQGQLILNGLWTNKVIRLDLNHIIAVKAKPYSTFFINNPVYNLHQKGRIRFYAGGKDAIWLTDRNGVVYIVGTQRPKELLQAILAATNQNIPSEIKK